MAKLELEHDWWKERLTDVRAVDLAIKKDFLIKYAGAEKNIPFNALSQWVS